MRTYCRNIVVLTLCGCVLASLVSAQITFSRDWSGGKRSGPPAAAPQLALDCGQFARLCRHFIHELKTSMASDATAGKRRRPADDVPTIYDDE